MDHRNTRYKYAVLDLRAQTILAQVLSFQADAHSSRKKQYIFHKFSLYFYKKWILFLRLFLLFHRFLIEYFEYGFLPFFLFSMPYALQKLPSIHPLFQVCAEAPEVLVPPSPAPLCFSLGLHAPHTSAVPFGRSRPKAHILARAEFPAQCSLQVLSLKQYFRQTIPMPYRADCQGSGYWLQKVQESLSSDTFLSVFPPRCPTVQLPNDEIHPGSDRTVSDRLVPAPLSASISHKS